MIFLYSPTSSSKSIFGIVVTTSLSPSWISAALAAAFFCTVLPRTSPCLGRTPLVCFACCWRWLCSSACCWLCSSACRWRWLCSSACCSNHRSSSSCSSRCPRYSLLLYFVLVATGLLAVVPCLGFSPLTLWLWFRLCFFFRVTLW